MKNPKEALYIGLAENGAIPILRGMLPLVTCVLFLNTQSFDCFDLLAEDVGSLEAL